ncbi:MULTISPECIES: zinc-binding dehydrogenase [unclassified Paenibacillus]|uniref:zinc-binding dehydrogenase n=1 Tax=unclassified Paenibacillus TaxID=185978 RepID=UPI002285B89E|nr:MULTISPECIES: zinc-binding dehydrogenase [unclassified Paenibacillus]
MVINYEEQHVGDLPDKVDVVLDTIGGDVLARSYEVLKPEGRLVTITGQPDLELARGKGITAYRVRMETNTEQLAAIADLVSIGSVKVVVIAYDSDQPGVLIRTPGLHTSEYLPLEPPALPAPDHNAQRMDLLRPLVKRPLHSLDPLVKI